MAISFKDLKTSQDEANRKVRDYVSTPQGAIEIYEPTVADIIDIIKLQKSQSGSDIPEEEVEFEGVTVIKELFPLLTNLDLSDLTDEEIKETIENPSIHLLTVQQVVTQIVQEANKYYAQKVKTEIVNAESTMAQVDLINSIPSVILNRANYEGESNEYAENVVKVEKEIEEMINKASSFTPSESDSATTIHESTGDENEVEDTNLKDD